MVAYANARLSTVISLFLVYNPLLIVIITFKKRAKRIYRSWLRSRRDYRFLMGSPIVQWIIVNQVWLVDTIVLYTFFIGPVFLMSLYWFYETFYLPHHPPEPPEPEPEQEQGDDDEDNDGDDEDSDSDSDSDEDDDEDDDDNPPDNPQANDEAQLKAQIADVEQQLRDTRVLLELAQEANRQDLVDDLQRRANELLRNHPLNERIQHLATNDHLHLGGIREILEFRPVDDIHSIKASEGILSDTIPKHSPKIYINGVDKLKDHSTSYFRENLVPSSDSNDSAPAA